MALLRRFIQDTRRYIGYAYYAARAELKSDINDSYLSWVWLFLEPFCFMLIYAFIVQVVFHTSEQYLPIFVFIGLTAWNFFNKSLTTSVRIVKMYKSIVTKTYLPKFVLIYVRVFVNGFQMLISFLIVFIMMAFYGVPITWNVLYFFPLVILLLVGSFAGSTLLLHFGTFVDDLSNIINIVLRLVFYLSGIFYSLATRVPKPIGPALVYYNPIAFVINEFRNILLYGKPLYLKWYIAWMIVSLIIAFIGIALIYKHESKYAKVI